MAGTKAAATAKAVKQQARRRAQARPKKGAAAQRQASAGPKMIKVRATKMGYYDHVRRRPGDVFMVPVRLLSEKWMELADKREAERVTTVEEALQREHDDILAMKYGDKVKAAGTEPDPIGDDD